MKKEKIKTKMSNEKKFELYFIIGVVSGFLFGMCLALMLIKSIVCLPYN